jgi:phosphatidylglycerophosphatase C
MSRIIAAFDFDGTLSHHDVLLPFLKYSFGKTNTYLKLLKLAPALTSFALGNNSRQDVKESLITTFMKDLPLSMLEQLSYEFTKGPLKKMIRKEAFLRLKWHQDSGHLCLIVSANLAFLLKPFQEEMKFDHLLASELEISKEKRLTGKIHGLNCFGKEKVRRLEALLGHKKDYTLYAYGDSLGDLELLEYADFPFYRTFT